jgi:hypothetical protein
LQIDGSDAAILMKVLIDVLEEISLKAVALRIIERPRHEPVSPF